MTIQHPIITYRLTRDGRIPPFICKHESAFAGMYGVNTNKEGYMPIWISPQETKYIGMSCGPIDPDGTPRCVDVIETKEELESYITNATAGQIVNSEGVTNTYTETTTGPIEAWNSVNDPEYDGPELTVTTTDKVATPAPTGTVIEHTGEYVTKIVTETSYSSDATSDIKTEEFEIKHPYTNITIVETEETVDVSQYSERPMEEESVTVEVKTTTTRVKATHQDITENYSDSFTTVDADGVVTKTRVRTFNEVTRVSNPFDPIAASNELWDRYEIVNEL